jgi:hypothetical protein
MTEPKINADFHRSKRGIICENPQFGICLQNFDALIRKPRIQARVRVLFIKIISVSHSGADILARISNKGS